jgi:hypothetical protein
MADPGMAWTTGLVAFVAAVPLWRFTRHTITVAHEGAHAVLGMFTGVKVGRVTLSSGGGGSTGFPPKIPWMADLLITVAGYLGPSAVGLSGVFLLLHDQAETELWISLGLLAFLLFRMGNPLGFVAVIGTGVVLWYVATHWSNSAQLAFCYSWVWFLLMGGTRTIPALFWAVHWGDSGSDAAVLQGLTKLPDIFWLTVFWLASMAALVYGGVRLLKP